MQKKKPIDKDRGKRFSRSAKPRRAKKGSLRVELFTDENGKIWFRVKSANNEIIAMSQAYKSKAGAEKTLKKLMDEMETATIQDLTSG